MVLLAGCSTGRQAETSHAQQHAAASRAGSASPDFDASAMRVRTLLEQLVAADTENPPGNEARAAALGAARLQAAVPAAVPAGHARLLSRHCGQREAPGRSGDARACDCPGRAA